MNDIITKHYEGHRERLKKKFLENPESLMDYEIIELILFYAIPRRDVKPLAKKLLNDFESLEKLLYLSKEKKKDYHDLSLSAECLLSLIPEIIKRIMKEKIDNKKPILSNWNNLMDYLRTTMGHLNIEQFRVLFLNSKLLLIADECKSGTINNVAIYPREILKRAIFHDATSIILVHNHPSGNVKPSKSDIVITSKIIEACSPVGIDVIDHLIVGSKKVFSFKSNNLI